MRTEKINVYMFDELSNEAKQKAIEWYRNGNEMGWMPEQMHEELLQKLEESEFYEFEDVKCFYSLACCQGDGFMFEMRAKYNDYYVKVKHSGHYYHKYSRIIEIYDEEGEYASDEVDEVVAKKYEAICDAMEKYGYEFIDHENEDENIAETIIVNEYEFTEDGSRY